MMNLGQNINNFKYLPFKISRLDFFQGCFHFTIRRYYYNGEPPGLTALQENFVQRAICKIKYNKLQA